MDDASSMAAAVAYYLALSLFPVLLLLTSGLGLFLRYTSLGQDAEQQLLAIVADHCSPSLERQVEALVLGFEDQSLISGPFGLLASLAAAIGVFHQFERAFDKIWRIPPPPRQSWLQAVARLATQRLTAFTLLLGVGLAIAAILTANVALGAMREWMTSLSVVGTLLITLVDAAATLVLNSLIFATLYRWLPKRKVMWQDALRSGLLVALVWEVGRQFLSAFLIGMRYTTTYGAIGSFIAILLWFYWGVTILFFGAEYVQVLTQRHTPPLEMFKADKGLLPSARELARTSNGLVRPRRAA
jgi:membrane protein